MINIRPFASRDLGSLYDISLATGLSGKDASHLYSDPKLIGHIYSAPYALLEPTLAFVVEDELGVSGFVVGVTDTSRWEERLEQDWWPHLRKQYRLPSDERIDEWIQDERRASAIHRPAKTPGSIANTFPAHVHLNILPRLQGRGVGSELFRHWLAAATKECDVAIHVGINRSNDGASMFWTKMGFNDLDFEDLPKGRTIWKGR